MAEWRTKYVFYSCLFRSNENPCKMNIPLGPSRKNAKSKIKKKKTKNDKRKNLQPQSSAHRCFFHK